VLEIFTKKVYYFQTVRHWVEKQRVGREYRVYEA